MITQQLQDKLNRHQTYLDQDPNNANLRLTVGLLKAQILHHQQKTNEAITLLEQLDHKSSAEVSGLLALLHFDNQDALQAELFSNKALTLNPTHYEAQLVQMLLKALKNQATLDEINTLIQINPQDSRLWFALGSTHMRHLNIPAAEQAFSQATLIWPDFYDSWICTGWCHLLQDNLNKAEMAYKQAKNIDIETADGWAGLALVKALRNDMAEAEKQLQQSDALDPKCFLAEITRIILANQSNPDEAVKQFNQTFPEIAPEINKLLLGKRFCYGNGGNDKLPSCP